MMHHSILSFTSNPNKLATPAHILVFRFSALGDVAMTVPVIRNLLKQYPALQITMVSDPFMAPLFAGINRLTFIGADTRKDYKGLRGLYRLAGQLNKVDFDAVADLHNVLRTKITRLFLRRVPSAVIDKGRAEKKELTRPDDKRLRQLKTGFERYADVFAALGLPVELKREDGFGNAMRKRQELRTIVRSGSVPELKFPDPSKTWIGIAPFARHAPKMYPLDKMKQVAQLLAAQNNLQVILFGSKAEAKILDQWKKDFQQPGNTSGSPVISFAGKISFEHELEILGKLDVMISMDSANMHLASLFGVRVVSVWGGTHPFLGFYGWGQRMEDAIQLELPCRPSSVFGNKPCPVHGEQGCMNGIEPRMIVDRVMAGA